MTMRWRRTLMLGAVAAVAALALPAAAQPLPENAWRADLQQLQAEFLARDRAYSLPARRLAEQRLARLRARHGAIDATRLALELAQIAALADNGHSLAYAGPRAAIANRVGLRLVPFGRDFHVVLAQRPLADLLGARLVAIDRVPIKRLREHAHRLAGGVAAWRDRQAPLLLESPQQLHAMGLAHDAASAVYAFVTLDGRRLERRLRGEPPGPDRPVADVPRLMLPRVVPPGQEDSLAAWQTLLPPQRAPWALRDPGQALRWRTAPEIDVVVIDMRQTFSAPGADLPAFFAEVHEAIERHRPRHLVLDLRLNGGGDLTQARDFAEGLPARVPGQVFVLTSPATFSAAISITGYLKQAAPARVRIVGEALGDRLEFFAEGQPVELVHSGQVLLPATERHDYRHGCRAHHDCHAPVVQRPISVSSLTPDVAAPWTVEAYRRGEDPAMQAVAREIQR
jgi:hypothetical protein